MSDPKLYLIWEFSDDTRREDVEAMIVDLEPLSKGLADKFNVHGHIEVFEGTVEEMAGQ